MATIIVSDAGPLISLEKISGGYEFIKKLYTTMIVPSVVMDEVTSDRTAYLAIHGIADLIQVHEPIAVPRIVGIERLHEGERQALALAILHQAPLLIEEEEGRRVATQAGIPFSGIAGEILKSAQQEIISQQDAIAKLTDMKNNGRLPKRLTRRLIDSLAR